MKKATIQLAIGIVSMAGALAVVGIGAPLAMAQATSGAEKPRTLPVIVKRECGTEDANGVKTCTITYENGVTQTVKMKDGQIVHEQG